MDLRVTPQTVVGRAIASARRNYDVLANLQEQAATGRRVLRPSDDPAATATLLASRAQSLRLDGYLENLHDARAVLDLGVSAMREAGDILSSAREIAIEGAHATNDSAAFEGYAREVDALITRLLDVANRRDPAGFLFGGTADQGAPFEVDESDGAGQPLAVGYTGSRERSVALVAADYPVATRYPGSQVFQRRERGATIFTGQTGAARGTGTDSATAQGTLIVRHTSTTFAIGSGVSAGTSSPDGDTIIGPVGAHRLTINDTSGTGSSGTVSLDGGPPIAFSNSDIDLKISGPQGQVVFLNTTAISAGFNGTLDITANGSLSVDGGATSTAIDFSANQVVRNSETGDVTNVDSSSIRRTGSEHLDYAGTYDAFQVLAALRDDLRNTRGLTGVEQAESLSRRIAELDRVRGGVLDAMGEQSAGLQNLDAIERRIQDAQLATARLASELESADLSAVVLGLQSQQNLLQLTFAAAARVMDQSLLDFLQ